MESRLLREEFQSYLVRATNTSEGGESYSGTSVEDMWPSFHPEV